MTGKPFAVDLGKMRSRRKDISPQKVEDLDQAAEQHGFISRETKGKRGRKPSPRTGQVHAKVLPHISEEIAEEARRRGVTQGVVIEDAWKLYSSKFR